MDKLVPAFETSLFDNTLSDACVDMAELGIDSILDDGMFKNILIVGVLIGIGKTAQNIHDRNLLRQTIKFINTFNERSITPGKLRKYKDHIGSSPKCAEEELGRVIIILNSNLDLKKSEILARFYRSYVEERINWDTFCELSEVTSRMFASDLELLFNVYSKQISDTTQCAAYRADRLIALGLLDSALKSISSDSLSGKHTQRYIQTNALGNIFCELCK